MAASHTGPIFMRGGKHLVSGWKLDERDRIRLLDQFLPAFPRVVADHVTLRFGTNGDTPWPIETLGKEVGRRRTTRACRRW